MCYAGMKHLRIAVSCISACRPFQESCSGTVDIDAGESNLHADVCKFIQKEFEEG